MLLDFICEGAWASRPGGTDEWTLSRKLAATMRTHADFRAEVYQRYERVPDSPCNAILELAIAEVADAEGVLILVRGHVLRGKPFDNVLNAAIKHVAVGMRPSTDWIGANEG